MANHPKFGRQFARKPAAHHFYESLSLYSKTSRRNTVFLPDVRVDDDVADVVYGSGPPSRIDTHGRPVYVVNGRTYVQKESGTLFPTGGPDCETFCREEFEALVVYKMHGTGQAAENLLDAATLPIPPNMRIRPKQFAQTAEAIIASRP